MDLISVFNTAFVICLSGAILFFVISVVLFFLFDIRTIFMIRSGRAQAKTVKEMQDANANTGRLRVGKTTQTSSLKKGKKTSKIGSVVPPVQPPAEASKPEIEYERTEQLENNETGAPFSDSAGTEASETDVLKESETTILKSDETSLLSQVDDIKYEADNQVGSVDEVYFDIVKKIICRDTDEVIR